MNRRPEPDPGPIDVNHFVLFESHLAPRGSTYETLAAYPLGGAGAGGAG
jgi:2'-5' RNA ligase